MFSAIILVLVSVSLLQVNSFKIPARELSDVGLTPDQMIENHGYVCETHHVTTEDGYILTLHRIPHGKDDDSKTDRPPVYVMHGLVSSSADFVNMGPDRSLGFILADLGYDVWLANARGNTFSRNHTTLSAEEDKAAFFNFTWHEIGYYDLANSIDHILETTKQDSLYYIGHSQGTTSFLVLTSTRPEYNDKIRLANLLAPAAFLEHSDDIITVELAKYIYDVEKVLNKWGVFEIPYLDIIREWAKENCDTPDYQELCVTMIFFFGGAADEDQLDYDKLNVISSNAPADASMKQFFHYGQLVRNGGFSKYDFGEENNILIYGSSQPPAYDLSQISAPVAVYYGNNDDVAVSQDALLTASKLPNLVELYAVPYAKFNHIDFIYAKDVVDLVYKQLIYLLERY